MARLPRLPARVPIGTKYVLESRGPLVRRYIEFPDGRRVHLTTRKALTCTCAELQRLSIIPDQKAAAVAAPLLRETASPE
jgi:hypothetical protein